MFLFKNVFDPIVVTFSSEGKKKSFEQSGGECLTQLNTFHRPALFHSLINIFISFHWLTQSVKLIICFNKADRRRLCK